MKKRIIFTLLIFICTICLVPGLTACTDSTLTLKNVTAHMTEDGETLTALDFELSDGTTFTVVDGINGGEGTTLESVTENYNDNDELETYTIKLSNDMSFTVDASVTLSAIIPNLSGLSVESYTIILSNGDRFTVYVTTAEINQDGGGEQSGNQENQDEQSDQGGGEDNEPEIDLTETEGLSYELSEDESYYILSGIGDCTETAIVVPAEYNGLPVKEIRDWAFSSDENITSVVIHEDIEYIGESAFFACTSLTQIIALDGNENYKSVDGNLYTADGARLMQYAAGKTETAFSVPSGVTTIDDGAFAKCNLVSVTLPEGVETISFNLFWLSENLESVVIPSSVTLVDGYAFANCANLKNIYYLGGSMEQFAEIEIVDSEYDDEDNDYFVTASVYYYSENTPASFTYYWTYDVNGDVALWYDVTAENGLAFTLSETKDYYLVLNIGNFTGTDIIIPETFKNLPVNGIADWAFSSEEITSVVIPVSVTKIYSNAFWGCESLTAVYYLGTNAQYESIEIIEEEETDYGNDYFANATVYYYSESRPAESGNYWRYDSNGSAVKW